MFISENFEKYNYKKKYKITLTIMKPTLLTKRVSYFKSHLWTTSGAGTDWANLF